MRLSDTQPGDTVILPDGSAATRRPDGGFRIRGLPAPTGAAALAHTDPAVTSGDGTGATVNMMTTPEHVAAAVKAHAKVPAPLRPGYRRKVIGAARKMGALRHIPTDWMTGKERA